MQNRPKEVLGLDILRFFAATAVMFSHLAWGSWSDPRNVSATGVALLKGFQSINPIVSVGWIGVQIFFVISGFVIIYSANGVSALDFARKRFLRLFPGVLICASVGVLFLFLDGIDFVEVAIKFVNSIIFSPKGPWVANSYWTLSVEIVFYGLIFLIIMANMTARTQFFSELLLMVSMVFWIGEITFPHFMENPPVLFTLNNLTQRLLLQYGCFFSLGITFWLSNQFGWTARRLIVLVLDLIVCIIAIMGEVDHASKWFGFAQSKSLALAIFAGSMVLFYASIHWNLIISAALGRLAGPVKLAGRATYPLYLMHQPVGETVMHYLASRGVDPFPALGIAIGLSLTLAFIVASILEPRMRAAISRMIDRIIPAQSHVWLTQPRAPITG